MARRCRGPAIMIGCPLVGGHGPPIRVGEPGVEDRPGRPRKSARTIDAHRDRGGSGFDFIFIGGGMPRGASAQLLRLCRPVCPSCHTPSLSLLSLRPRPSRPDSPPPCCPPTPRSTTARSRGPGPERQGRCRTGPAARGPGEGGRGCVHRARMRMSSVRAPRV